MLNHLAACPFCPKYQAWGHRNIVSCIVYTDTTWINRRGGCPVFPYRDMPELMKKRVGQQKQAHSDRTYRSKNDRVRHTSGATKRKFVFKHNIKKEDL